MIECALELDNFPLIQWLLSSSFGFGLTWIDSVRIVLIKCFIFHILHIFLSRLCLTTTPYMWDIYVAKAKKKMKNYSFPLLAGVSASGMLMEFCKLKNTHDYQHDTALLLTR